MAIERRFCKNHPDRPAIGVCVITHEAICSECSTRYEGVNYSREGLRIVQERRRMGEKSRSRWLVSGALTALAPVLLWLVYWSFYLGVDLLMRTIHWEF
jgi:hypothetical protein